VLLDDRRALPFASACADCVAAIHVLQDLFWDRVEPLLAEFHRVLKSGGVLRVAVPDLDKAMRAYLDGDASYFYVPDRDARSIGAKMITQIVWYGSVHTPCTFSFLDEWLRKRGFADVVRYAFGESAVDGLASLDNRERESLFIEAVKR
jgi:ubiquinone/menaquinone biosynthesis C-methylase UbiE